MNQTQEVSSTSYCPFCGRDRLNQPACIHTARVSKCFVLAIYVTLLILPLHLMVVQLSSSGDLAAVDYRWISNIALAAVMAVLLVLGRLMKKPLLAILFGCHQMRSRSFYVFGRLFLLCARCSGMLIGVFALLLWRNMPILILDGALQKWTVYESNNVVRFITGVLFAPMLTFLYALMPYAALHVLHWVGVI